MTPHVTGTTALDKLAHFVSPKKTYEMSKPFIAQLLSSQNPWERKAAMAALTLLARNCGDLMREDLDKLLPMVCFALSGIFSWIGFISMKATVKFEGNTTHFLLLSLYINSLS